MDDLNIDTDNIGIIEEDGMVILPGINDLPEFANADAKKLHRENLENEKQIEIITDQVYDMKDRIKIMKEHFKNVQQEVDHTNSLQSAKQSEVQTELHLRQLTSRTLGRSQLESKNINNEIEFLKDQLNNVQSLIYKSNEKMDEFKMQMNWNQDELEQWAIASKQKEDDNLIIEKYKRADEMKIKELTLKLEHLTRLKLANKLKLENEITDTNARQIELDRIAIEFKNAHHERQQLVSRWQDTIIEMKRRDKEINEIGERFSIAKLNRSKKESELNLQRKRLLAQQGENKEVEIKSETLSRIVLRKREEMMNGSNKLIEFRSELESLKNELTTSSESLVAKRNNNHNKAVSLEEKKVQLERERQKYKNIKDKLEKAQASTNKAELTAKQAEQELSELEKNFNNELMKANALKDKAIKETQAVHDLKREEVRLRSDISGSKSIIRNLESQLQQLDKEAARQQELLYNAEFQIQQIERKVARGMGERSDEEKNQLKKQIVELENQLDTVKDKRKMLLAQSRKLHNELVASRMNKENLLSKFTKLTDILSEKELENKMIEEEIRRDNKNLEEMIVSNDLLKLEVRRLKDLLSAKSDAVYSLENRKQQLLLSMEERKQEILVHKDILIAEQKALNDAKHNLVMEVRNREANIDRLKSRFESIARSSSETDEKHSQSYYIIKAAQRREELQRRGDQLDQDVRRCEREIRALQTTLDHLNTRNTAFRESFQKVDLKGDDVEILKQLEERTKLGKDNLFRKKKELQRIVTDFEEDSRRLEQVKIQSEKMIRQRDHLSNAKLQVEEEILTQQAQLDELNERIDKIVSKHRTKVADAGNINISVINQNGTLEEKAVKAEVLKDVVQVRYNSSDF